MPVIRPFINKLLKKVIKKYLTLEADEQLQVLLDATPLVMNFWNSDYKNIFTNEEAVKLFELSSKQEYLDKFFDLSPEYQKDGSLSKERAYELIKKTFDEGYCRFLWDHQKLNGEIIPCEITLVRVRYQKGFIVAGYTRDIRDMVKLMDEKENAEHLSRQKNVFLANISHEIRTPMNVILGITEIQLQNEVNSKETKEALTNIYNSGYLLLKIINNILDLSKIESGKLDLEFVNYNVSDLIHDTLNMFVMHYDNKPIHFIIHVDENIPELLYGDDLRIKQILNNLLTNAFKYTDQGEIIFSVLYETQNGSAVAMDNKIILVFCVQDTGQGMDKNQLEKLFEEYTRFNLEANHAVEGIGLGMPITKYLVNLMDGEINVESNPGKGSVFTVKLPQIIVDRTPLGKTASEKLRKFRIGQSSAIVNLPQIDREYMPYGRVLLVDDVDTNLYVARGLMDLYGLSTDTVSSGFEAIEKINSGSTYDIVFMDHFMPKMDGIQATKIIRDIGYQQPIVALTANAMIGQAEIFIEKGFNGFISKPIDVYQLDTILNKFVRDTQSPEVVEAARKLKSKLKNNSKKVKQSNLDEKLTDAFVREAEKAASALIKLLENNFKRQDDLQSYIIIAHSMKSALENIYEPGHAVLAATLEKAGLQKDFTLINNETPAFIEALETLSKKYKSNEKDADVYPDNKELSDEDILFLLEKLSIIKSTCVTFNNKEARNALDELKQRVWPRRISNNLNEISVHLLHSAFKTIAIITENTMNMCKTQSV
jgi:signal transduction histidine kinase/CheY-like chemotaxis protein/HPt (histidine-containing phosphotransfer) domain-containing protein